MIDKDTIEWMQSGIIDIYAYLVDGLVMRMVDEMCGTSTVVATGGLAEIVAAETKSINEVDPHLTLNGLKIIYDRMRQRLGAAVCSSNDRTVRYTFFGMIGK